MLGEKKSRSDCVSNDGKDRNYMNEEKTLMDHSIIDNIIDKYDTEKGSLISILRDIQMEYEYLTPESLKHVSKRLDLPLMQVYSVAMYYNEFKVGSPTFPPNRGISSDNKPTGDYLSKFRK